MRFRTRWLPLIVAGSAYLAFELLIFSGSTLGLASFSVLSIFVGIGAIILGSAMLTNKTEDKDDWAKRVYYTGGVRTVTGPIVIPRSNPDLEHEPPTVSGLQTRKEQESVKSAPLAADSLGLGLFVAGLLVILSIFIIG